MTIMTKEKYYFSQVIYGLLASLLLFIVSLLITLIYGMDNFINIVQGVFTIAVISLGVSMGFITDRKDEQVYSDDGSIIDSFFKINDGLRKNREKYRIPKISILALTLVVGVMWLIIIYVRLQLF